MQANGTFLEEIPRDECLRLIATAAVGRIIYTRQALPAVDLVSFEVHDADIVIRTSLDGNLAAAIRGAVVAFEVDSLDPAGKSGWSVTAIGRSHEHGHLIRIHPEIVNGRMLSQDDDEGPAVSGRSCLNHARSFGVCSEYEQDA